MIDETAPDPGIVRPWGCASIGERMQQQPRDLDRAASEDDAFCSDLPFLSR